MRFAISNLAWNTKDDLLVANMLRDYKIYNIELAPTKIWDHPIEIDKEEIYRYSDFWNSMGFSIVAIQSLLFGRKDLKLFSSVHGRLLLEEYLRRMIDLASDLDAKILVFGSPKNRQRGKLSLNEANKIVIPIFRRLGEYAFYQGTKFCIEPDAIEYGCDYIITSDDGYELVSEVNSSGFGLHLDYGCMTLAKENIEEKLKKYIPLIQHFHISIPMLGYVQSCNIYYIINCVKNLEERNNIVFSVEMSGGDDNLSRIEDVCKCLSKFI